MSPSSTRSSTSTRSEIAASAHAVAASAAERFRNTELSADDVVEFRELTALGGRAAPSSPEAHGTLVMRPARLNAYRAALATFVESRDDAEWLREEDREPLAIAAASCGRSRSSPPRRCRRRSRGPRPRSV